MYYSEQHTTHNNLEQHAKYSEQYVNFSEQHALWLLYKISSKADRSFGVWTLEIVHQSHHCHLVTYRSNYLKRMAKWAKMKQVNKKWTNMSKVWIRASEARLAIYVTLYFPRNVIKNYMYQSFPIEYDIKSIHHTCSFYDYVLQSNKRTYFHRWHTHIYMYIYTFFYIFAHGFF